MRTPALIVRDLDLVKRIIVTDFASFHDNDMDVDEKQDLMFYKNPFHAKGDAWKPAKAQLTQLFTPARVSSPFFSK